MDRTLYFWRRSVDSGALIRILRKEEGAEKWAFRFLRLEEETLGLYFMVTVVVATAAAEVRGFLGEVALRGRNEERKLKAFI
jgi:hypothetical protein